jgi:hypothetical protein
MISESASIYAGGAFGVITELYVIPEKRSAGAAKLPVDATVALGREPVLELCRGRGSLSTNLGAQPEILPAQRLYQVGPRFELLL